MYTSIAVKLKKTSKRVIRLLEREGITNPSQDVIVLSKKIYDESKFQEIESYFYRKYSKLYLHNDPDAEVKRREFLKENLILPRGIKFRDISGFLNHLDLFKKLKNTDLITAGVFMERFIINGSEQFLLLNRIPQRNNRVYAFQLNDSIKDEVSFLNHNPNMDKNKPAFYVGQTSKSREERHNEHINGIRANRFMENFGIKSVETADKTYELAELFNISVDDLMYYEAQDNEFKLTMLLQENGYGAYCK
jgi:hypothetical protein